MEVQQISTSEKEELTPKPDEIEVVVDEIPPRSSPEGVFIVNDLNNVPHEEIVEEQPEQMDHLLAEHQQLISDPNSILITQEDIYEAGLDVDTLDNLTEEQLQMLIAISEQRQAKQQHEEIETEVVGEHEEMVHQELVQDVMIPNDSSFAVILTDDGGLKVTDQANQDIYFSLEQLNELNINVNELTVENVEQLVHLAIPSITIEKHTAVLSNRKPSPQQQIPSEAQPSTSYHSESTRQSLIGETVHIRMEDGRVQAAIVRYIRGNSYKIQLMDGEFAYASPDQIIMPKRLREHERYHTSTEVLRSNDHPGPSSSSSPHPSTSSSSASSKPTQRHLQKRPAHAVEEEEDEMCPPVLKRSYVQQLVQESHHHSPNFCCPICDKKVFQKEPSYIVIRLPACDSCTREKILVLDEQNP